MSLDRNSCGWETWAPFPIPCTAICSCCYRPFCLHMSRMLVCSVFLRPFLSYPSFLLLSSSVVTEGIPRLWMWGYPDLWLAYFLSLSDASHIQLLPRNALCSHSNFDSHIVADLLNARWMRQNGVCLQGTQLRRAILSCICSEKYFAAVKRCCLHVLVIQGLCHRNCCHHEPFIWYLFCLVAVQHRHTWPIC